MLMPAMSFLADIKLILLNLINNSVNELQAITASGLILQKPLDLQSLGFKTSIFIEAESFKINSWENLQVNSYTKSLTMLSYVKRFGIGDASISCSIHFQNCLSRHVNFQKSSGKKRKTTFFQKEQTWVLSLGIGALKATYSFFLHFEDKKANSS